MPWAWVRPADPTVLDGRPLLDLGTGDGQTLAALIDGAGLVVGIDRALDALRSARRTVRSRLVCAEAARLPFRDATFRTVLAADLFHHLSDTELTSVLEETRRVVGPGGRLVAWWYEREGRPGPDAPGYPRRRASLTGALGAAGFVRSEVLPLTHAVDPAPPTTGVVAYA